MVVDCPYCDAQIEIDAEWVKTNERVFCPNCCKAFDVKVTDKKAEDDWDWGY